MSERLGERHPLEQAVAMSGNPFLAGSVLDHGLYLIRRYRSDANQGVLEVRANLPKYFHNYYNYQNYCSTWRYYLALKKRLYSWIKMLKNFFYHAHNSAKEVEFFKYIFLILDVNYALQF